MAISAVTPRVAVAADKAACAAAYEQTQKLRKQGKLRDARAKARVCGESSCPKVVAGDCATWASELDDAIPTITLVVKDADGADVSDVTVTLDGEPLADSLDGKAIAVDPGKHTLWFERSGSAPAESDFLAREGEKNRAIEVTLKPASSKSDVAAKGDPAGDDSTATDAPKKDDGVAKTDEPASDTAADTPSETPSDTPSEGDRPTPAATYAFGTAGLVGLLGFAVVGSLALSGKSSLDSDHCKPACSESSVDAVRTKAHVADLFLGVGVVSIGIATVLYLTRGPADSKPATTDSAFRFDVAPMSHGGQAMIGFAF